MSKCFMNFKKYWLCNILARDTAWGWFHWWSLQTLDIFEQKRMCEKFHPFCSTVGFEWSAASLKGSLMKIPWNAIIKHVLSIYNVMSTLNIYWVSTIYLLRAAVHGVAKGQTWLSELQRVWHDWATELNWRMWYPVDEEEDIYKEQ